MRKLTISLSFIILFFGARAQQKKTDSLKKLIATAKDDTTKVSLVSQLSYLYIYSKPDTALSLALQAGKLSEKIQYHTGEGKSLNLEGIVYDVKGNYPKALASYLAALKIFEDLNDRLRIAKLLGNIGVIYHEQGDHKQAIKYALRAIQGREAVRDKNVLLITYINVGSDYAELKMLDSAMIYSRQAYQLALKMGDVENLAISAGNLGDLYDKKKQVDSALYYDRKAMQYMKQAGDDDNLCEIMLSMAGVFKLTGKRDSALYYAHEAASLGQHGGFIDKVLASSQFLTAYFKEQGQLDSAFHYQEIAITAKDGLFSQEKTRELQNLASAERERQQDIQEKEKAYQANLRYYLFCAAIALLLIVAFIFWRNSWLRQKANNLLQQQNEEIEARKKYAEMTLSELKATQNQLVQREKMASLGELTAGIAHEIQNPLNFVNNFSEVNTELIDEMEQEIIKGDLAEVSSIAADIKANQQKISQHGKRADFIVKGMLEHSRVSNGERTVTNINVLADEFLKLSYHGLRAKDKSFNANLVTNFDKNIPHVELVQQDIGRVLLNLFNNAFYAVNQKQKTVGPDYKPVVEVSTLINDGQAEILVKDNGSGIADSIKDKIMQPFFTTKPTGEGTGLGLSLSYDIVTKGHGGSISVDSKEGESTTFTIRLPVLMNP